MLSVIYFSHYDWQLSYFVYSGSKSAIITSTTVEIIVPENVIGSVYGENGGNLARLRKVTPSLHFSFFPPESKVFLCCYMT